MQQPFIEQNLVSPDQLLATQTPSPEICGYLTHSKHYGPSGVKPAGTQTQLPHPEDNPFAFLTQRCLAP